MNTSPFFSIVMPVYGVEAYLAAALDSVLSQTFTDFEVILVNDASPDGCGEICAAYAAKDPRVTLLTHEENKGLSAARNTGFASVRGEYVWFMDSDDTVDSTLLQQVYDSLQSHEADAVVFGCVEEYYDAHGNVTATVPLSVPAAQCDTATQLGEQILTLELATLFGYAWNKVYRVSRLRQTDLRYENVVLIEDVVYNVSFFETAQGLNVLSCTPYHYAKRGSGSLTARFVPEYYAVHRRRTELLYAIQCRFGNDTPAARAALGGLYVRYIFSAFSRNCDKRANMTNKDRRAFALSLYEDPLFTALIPAAAPQGVLLKGMAWLLKGKHVTLSLMLGRVLHFVQHRLRSLFVKAKQQRI